MRISDWSSDVCSSDLDGRHRRVERRSGPNLRVQLRLRGSILMARPDASASAALAAAVIKPAFIGFLDIVGDPVRVTTWGASLTFSGTGDPDLDGYTYSAIDPQLVDIGPVKQAEGGSDTVTAALSGLIAVDSDLMTLIGNPANWRGRDRKSTRLNSSH